MTAKSILMHRRLWRRRLREHNIDVESVSFSGGTHIKLRLSRGPHAFIYFVGSSPSDVNATNQALRDIKRAFDSMEQGAAK